MNKKVEKLNQHLSQRGLTQADINLLKEYKNGRKRVSSIEEAKKLMQLANKLQLGRNEKNGDAYLAWEKVIDRKVLAYLKKQILTKEDKEFIKSMIDVQEGLDREVSKLKVQTKKEVDSHKKDVEQSIQEIKQILSLGYGSKDNGEKMKRLQKTLKSLGYNVGPIDGLWGIKTSNALGKARERYLKSNKKHKSSPLDIFSTNKKEQKKVQQKTEQDNTFVLKNKQTDYKKENFEDVDRESMISFIEKLSSRLEKGPISFLDIYLNSQENKEEAGKMMDFIKRLNNRLEKGPITIKYDRKKDIPPADRITGNPELIARRNGWKVEEDIHNGPEYYLIPVEIKISSIKDIAKIANDYNGYMELLNLVGYYNKNDGFVDNLALHFNHLFKNDLVSREVLKLYTWKIENVEDVYEMTKYPNGLEAMFKIIGYKDDRGIITKLFNSGNEGELLRTVIKNFEKFKNNNQKLEAVKGYLFDLDKNGILDTKLNGYAQSEKMLDFSTISLNEIKNLCENIGLNYKKIGNNLALRYEFEKKLNTMLYMYPVRVLLQKNGPKKYNEKVKSYETNTLGKIEEIVNSPSFIQKIKNKLNSIRGVKATPENIEVVKEFTVGVMLGHAKSFGISKDLFKIGDKVVASLNLVQLAQGKSGLSLNANLFKQDFGPITISGNGGLSLPAAFYAGIGADANLIRKLSRHGAVISGGLQFSSGNVVKTLSIREIASDNVEGFTHMMKATQALTKYFVENISSDKISSSDLEKLIGEKPTSKEVKIVNENFQAFKEQYKLAIKQGKSSEQFVQAFLKGLANVRFKQTEGLKLTGLGYFIIPGIVAGIYLTGEYNYMTANIRERSKAEQLAEQDMTMEDIRKFVEHDPILRNNVIIEGDRIYVKPSIIVNKGKNIYGEKRRLDEDEYIRYRPEKGYKLLFTISRKEGYNEDKNTQISYKLDIKAVKVSGGELFDYNNKKIISYLNTIEGKFNAETRNYKGAKTILNPDKTLAERFEAVKVLALHTPKDFPILRIYKAAKTEKDKVYIVSKIAQYLRKSHQADINKSGTSLVNMDSGKRAEVFSEIEKTKLGVDLKSYRENLYEKFKGKHNLSEYTINGIGLDVVATLVKGKRVAEGIEKLQGGIQVVGDSEGAIFEKITDEATQRKLIKKMARTHIKEKDINKIIRGIKEGKLELDFVKTTGFDDAVILRVVGGSNKVEGSGSSTSKYADYTYHTIGGMLGWSWDETKKQEESKRPDDKEKDDKEKDDKEKESGEKESGEKESGEKESGDSEGSEPGDLDPQSNVPDTPEPDSDTGEE